MAVVLEPSISSSMVDDKRRVFTLGGREGLLHSAVGNVTVLLFWFRDIGVLWSASHTTGGVAEIAVFPAP